MSTSMLDDEVESNDEVESDDEVESNDAEWTVVRDKKKVRKEQQDSKKYFKKDKHRVLFHPLYKIRDYHEKKEYAYLVQKLTGDISLTARTLIDDLRCYNLEKDGWMVTRIQSEQLLPSDCDQVEKYVPFQDKQHQDHWIVFSK